MATNRGRHDPASSFHQPAPTVEPLAVVEAKEQPLGQAVKTAVADTKRKPKKQEKEKQDG